MNQILILALNSGIIWKSFLCWSVFLHYKMVKKFSNKTGSRFDMLTLDRQSFEFFDLNIFRETWLKFTCVLRFYLTYEQNLNLIRRERLTQSWTKQSERYSSKVYITENQDQSKTWVWTHRESLNTLYCLWAQHCTRLIRLFKNLEFEVFQKIILEVFSRSLRVVEI